MNITIFFQINRTNYLYFYFTASLSSLGETN